MAIVPDIVADLKELQVETQRLGQLYRKIFPKVDPALVYDLISRLEQDPLNSAPVYTIEVFAKDGTDSKNQEIIYCKRQEQFRLYMTMTLTMFQPTV